jgi:hypothetical protein
MGVLAGVGGALIAGTTAAYAGTASNVSYSCPGVPVLGTVNGIKASVTETPDFPTTTQQVPGTYTETYSASVTIPGSLLDTASNFVPSFDVDSFSIDIVPGGSGGFTDGTQTATATSIDGGAFPLVTGILPAGNPPVPTNPDLTFTVDLGPLTWHTAFGTGAGPWTASLTPGSVQVNVVSNSFKLGCNPVSSPVPTIDSMSTVSPPQDPVVHDQTVSVSAGQCVTVNALLNATDIGDVVDPTTMKILSGPTVGGGTTGTLVNNGDGTATYCAIDTPAVTAASATFTFDVQNSTKSDPLDAVPNGGLSNTGTVTVDISYNTCSAGTGNLGGGSSPQPPAATVGQNCSLHQTIVLPVEPGQIILSQNGGLPIDALGSSFCASPPGQTPGIQLNGQEQTACGRVSPLTVTNATGLDDGWTLTGQTTDFVDPGNPALPANPGLASCHTVATYNNHCIPGDNLGWQPDSAVSHDIVPGDTAQVASGPMLVTTPKKPPNTDPLLAQFDPSTGLPTGGFTQPNPVIEPDPIHGLQFAPQVMCDTASTHSGGTFICGAALFLAVPASTAEPTPTSPGGVPAYVATLTLTLTLN